MRKSQTPISCICQQCASQKQLSSKTLSHNPSPPPNFLHKPSSLSQILFIQTTMDPNHNMPPTGSHPQPPPSSSSPKMDKAKLAGKGGGLLHKASSFGKGKRLGKYLGKAENYLRKYQNTHSANMPHGAPGPANTILLAYPPNSGSHGYPSAIGQNGNSGNAVPIGYPPTGGTHSDSANAVPIGYPPAGGQNGNSGNDVPIGCPPIAHPNTVAGSANPYPAPHPGGNEYAGGGQGNSGGRSVW